MRSIRLSSGRTLTPTPVFDSYWHFAALRQGIFLQRVKGLPPPWTDDAVLRKHRFTNVFRASDRVSQHLIRHVAYEGEQTPEEIFFRIFLFKIFNKISTWNYLQDALGELSWRTFNLRHIDELLEGIRTSRTAIYSAAYIMPSPRLGAIRKHTNHLLLLRKMMDEHLPQKISNARSLEDIYNLLIGYPSMGRFLAFQLAIDLNYSSIANFSEMDFVVAGPGARDGIRKCFSDTAGYSDEDIIAVMTDIAEDEFSRMNLSFRGLWGRPLQLIDCQNLFCEVDKYARVVHPEVSGLTGRSRIKQKFSAKENPVPQWYPPKWKLRPPHPVENTSTVLTPHQALLF